MVILAVLCLLITLVPRSFISRRLTSQLLAPSLESNVSRQIPPTLVSLSRNITQTMVFSALKSFGNIATVKIKILTSVPLVPNIRMVWQNVPLVHSAGWLVQI
ncbi:hypothetical protein ACHAW6_010729 [Cyclotella cf. meneghiniana]